MARKNSGMLAVAGVAVVVVLLFAVYGFNPQAQSIVGTETATIGVPYAHSFALTYTPAQTNYSTGYVEQIDCNTYVAGSSSVIQTGTAQVANGGSYSGTVTWTPTAQGSYLVGAICMKRSNTFITSAQAWGSWTTPTELVKQEVQLTVSATNTPPPTTPSIDWLSSIWAGIAQWFCNNLHIGC